MQRMPRRAGIGIATDEELYQMSKERQRASFNETHGMFLPQRVCLLQPGVPIWEERERGYGPFIDRHVLDWQGIQLCWVYARIAFFLSWASEIEHDCKSRLNRL